MFHKISYTKYIFLTTVLLLVWGIMTPPLSATSSVGGQVISGVNQTGQAAFAETKTPGTLDKRLISIVNRLLTLLGILFFVVLLYGGWEWMTARGNEDQVNRAKVIVRDAVIGLIIIFSAALVTNFILSQISSALN